MRPPSPLGARLREAEAEIAESRAKLAAKEADADDEAPGEDEVDERAEAEEKQEGQEGQKAKKGNVDKDEDEENSPA